MSRSKKGKKPCGWDYWGKRPIGMGGNGTKGKRIGIKKERAKLKAEASKESETIAILRAIVRPWRQ